MLFHPPVSSPSRYQRITDFFWFAFPLIFIMTDIDSFCHNAKTMTQSKKINLRTTSTIMLQTSGNASKIHNNHNNNCLSSSLSPSLEEPLSITTITWCWRPVTFLAVEEVLQNELSIKTSLLISTFFMLQCCPLTLTC